jgi:myo-inositol-1(or 4)-monophosphatase
MDHRGVLGRHLVAGNLKVTEVLQKTIVSSGYAAVF